MIKDQMPPCDLDIEQSILAGCMMFEGIADEALDIIIPEDFYRTSHRIIFQVIQELSFKNHSIDIQIVASTLKDKNQLDEIGGAVYLANISDTAPVPSNVSVFCEKLKNLARLRQIITICANSHAICFDPSINSVDVINKFQTEALNLDEHIKSSFTTKKELTNQSIERYQELRTGKTERAISSGYRLIDKFLGGGFRGPKLVIIAARPGAGKTAFMCNLIKNMCNKNVYCGAFSLEMQKEELDDRWIADGADINPMNLTQFPGPDSEDWVKIMDAASDQEGWKLLIDDQGGLSIDELKRRARKMKKAGVQIIFIDQLSKIGGKRNMSVFERNTEHVEELGFLKKEIGLPVVLLAQLNRKLEDRNDKKPILSDLKNTGQLEEEADIVFLGYRKFIHTRDPADETHAEWEIAKNRQGATWNIGMHFNPQRMRFEVLDRDYSEEVERYGNKGFDGRAQHKNQ